MRTRSREIALQALFQFEFQGSQVPTDPTQLFQIYEQKDKESLDYARFLVLGVFTHRISMDETIERASHNWKVKRMGLVERNILRLSVFELLYGDDVTVATVIDEAVELAKRFGQTESGAFINGILDQIAREKKASS